MELVYVDGKKCEQDMIVYTTPCLDAFVTYPQLPTLLFLYSFQCEHCFRGKNNEGISSTYCTSPIRTFLFILVHIE